MADSPRYVMGDEIETAYGWCRVLEDHGDRILVEFDEDASTRWIKPEEVFL